MCIWLSSALHRAWFAKLAKWVIGSPVMVVVDLVKGGGGEREIVAAWRMMTFDHYHFPCFETIHWDVLECLFETHCIQIPYQTKACVISSERGSFGFVVLKEIKISQVSRCKSKPQLTIKSLLNFNMHNVWSLAICDIGYRFLNNFKFMILRKGNNMTKLTQS